MQWLNYMKFTINFTKKMGTITIKGMHFHAKHGYFREEQILGGKYTVDISFDTDLSIAGKSDDLRETIDYSVIYKLVKKEMQKPSKLIEHLGQRILNTIKIQFPTIKNVELVLYKHHPPINGSVDYFSVTLHG